MDIQDAYEEAHDIAETRLNRLYRKNKIIEEAEFDRVIEKAGEDLPAAYRERLRAEMQQRFSIFVPDSETLIDITDHDEWLLNARSTIDPRFWSRYRDYLQIEKGLPEPVLASTDALTEDILSYLENPKRLGGWDRRGMVVGQVQSGKTANYTGLICKAADAGYKLIIVLAGIHNSLRSQTQLRLDEGFLGRDTNQFRIFKVDSPKIGVGNLPGDSPDAIPLTTSHEKGDFRKKAAETLSLPFGTIPLIIVAKKNTGILNNLLSWIQNNVAEKQGDKKIVPGKVPLLLLDDEADNASIDIEKIQKNADGSFDEDKTVSKTNSLIRQILNTFERRSYVGYTATPFANIFIHPNATTRKEGEDLFPKSFIVNLRPPSNYIGPVQVFGLDVMDSDGSEGMPIVRSADDADIRFSSRHKMDIADELEQLTIDQLPPSLHEAVRAFVLVCAARRVRGQVSVHNSMLLHVTRYIRVQSAVTNLIQSMVADLKRRIRYSDGAQKPTLLEELRNLWERDFEPTSAAIRTDFFPTDGTLTLLAWDQIEPELLHAVEKIKVKEINGNAADALEYYENQEHGLSVIAIGGDKLSRGLTLEGLSVSYYLRTSYMYDTLMQMGRWFGYRPGYADLCRLYTSSKLREWYQHITMASEELRSEFDTMARLRLTPKDFGLKVLTHPGQLLVTSANKARFGQKIRMSYMGQLIESYALPKDKDSIDANLKAAQELIEKLDATITPEARGEAERNGLPSALIWRGVRPQAVMSFLKAFKGAPDTQGNAPSHASVPARQAEFIGKKIRQRSELTEWVVVLCSSTTGVKSDAVGHEIGLIQRTPADGSKSEDGIYYIRKNHIIDPRHESLDLTDAEQVEAMAEEKSLKPDAAYPRGGIARRIRPRQRGLLLLYALDPTIEKLVKHKPPKQPELMRLFPVGDPRCDPEKPVIGFAISFPGFGTRDNPDDAIEYLANTICVEELIGDEESVEDGDDDE